MELTLSERREGSTMVLAPAGGIDLTTEGVLRERLIPMVTAAAKAGDSVVLDFSDVAYISSAGLRVLMIAAKEARTCGGKIAIAALQPVVSEIYQIARFDKVLPCHASVDDAIKALASPS